jgi:hypothetical protein
LAHLFYNSDAFFPAQFALFDEQTFEILSLDKLHGDEPDSVGFSEVENPNRVFVGHLPRQDEFLFEPMQDFRLSRELGTNYLQGDQSLQFAILRLIHSAHASLAEQLQDLVPLPENGAYYERYSVGRMTAGRRGRRS